MFHSHLWILTLFTSLVPEEAAYGEAVDPFPKLYFYAQGNLNNPSFLDKLLGWMDQAKHCGYDAMSVEGICCISGLSLFNPAVSGSWVFRITQTACALCSLACLSTRKLATPGPIFCVASNMSWLESYSSSYDSS